MFTHMQRQAKARHSQTTLLNHFPNPLPLQNLPGAFLFTEILLFGQKAETLFSLLHRLPPEIAPRSEPSQQEERGQKKPYPLGTMVPMISEGAPPSEFKVSVDTTAAIVPPGAATPAPQD